MIQRWWTHNMPGDERPVTTVFFKVDFEPKPAPIHLQPDLREPEDFWMPYYDSEFTSSDEENEEIEMIVKLLD